MEGVEQSGRGKQLSQDLFKPVETCPPIPHSTLCLVKEHNMAKEVTFDPRPKVCNQYVWRFAYQQARKSVWEQYARDRDRFTRRIIESEHIINPVLNRLHRERVFASLYPHS